MGEEHMRASGQELGARAAATPPLPKFPEDGGASRHLWEQVRAVFTRPTYRPPILPRMALKVQELTRRSNVDLDDVGQVLEEDNLLCARVLRRAQSPVYAGLGNLLSIQDAVVRLGLRTIRDIVWEVVFNSRLFHCPEYERELETLRRHSLLTARLARLVATRTAIPAEYAFLGGLLHDVGAAACLVAMGDRNAIDRAPPAAVAPAIRAAHEEVSALLLSLWNLPPGLAWALRHHHDPQADGVVNPVTAMLVIAEHLATAAGAAAPLGIDPSSEGACFEAARAALRLSERQLSALATEAETAAGSIDE
jgi:HD-like signal output (HDOD) protein